MNSGGRIAIFVGAIVLIAAGFVYYVRQYLPKYNWVETYNLEEKQPYDLSLFYYLMQESEREFELLKNEQSLDSLDEVGLNYFAFQQGYLTDSSSAAEMMRFVEKGNNAFIIQNVPPREILDRVLDEADFHYDTVPTREILRYYGSATDTVTKIEFVQETRSYQFVYNFIDEASDRSWNIIPDTLAEVLVEEDIITSLSYVTPNLINYYKINYGKGAIYIHANPILFTNYFLMTDNGFDHANRVLKPMSSGKILWEGRTHVWESESRSGPSKSPLEFLFSDYRLKTAWYLFLVMTLIFVVFRAKREQRIIPILVEHKNTTIGFVKAIGLLYFQQKDMTIIGDELKAVFMYQVRTRYGIPANLTDDDLKITLTERSGVSSEIIEKIIKGFFTLKYNPTAGVEDLSRLYHALTQFDEKRK